MKKINLTLLLLALYPIPYLPANSPQPQQQTQTIQQKILKKHLIYLASDKLQGRAAASPQEKIAANYIAKLFQKYGLKGGGPNGSYFQKFPLTVGKKILPTTYLKLLSKNKTTNLQLSKNFQIHPLSPSSSFQGQLVFAGFGLQGKSYTNYPPHTNLQNKIPLVLEGIPWKKGHLSHYASYYNPRYKAMIAKQLGAKAILIATKKKTLIQHFQNTPGKHNSPIPILYLSYHYLQNNFQIPLQQWENSLTSSKKNTLQPLPLTIQAKINLRPIQKNALNVIAYLPGTHPKLKQHTLLLGAHYDHLGWGGPNSLAKKKAIHNGADDNASGTAALLAIAQTLATQTPPPNHTIVFIAFSAEEWGLLGSYYYTKHPTFPLKQTTAMINMDMIGRMRKKRLYIFGNGTAKEFPPLLAKINQHFQLHLNLSGKSGFGPSDHSSFYKHKIPVLHFFSGLHPDYHKPSDDPEKINYPGLQQITQFVLQTLLALDQLQKLTYVKIAPPPSKRKLKGIRVYLGVIPEYGGENTGLKINGVSQNSPAQQAGLQANDIILKLGKFQIKNIYDLTFALQKYKPGQKVPITILRQGKKLTLTVTFQAR